MYNVHEKVPDTPVHMYVHDTFKVMGIKNSKKILCIIYLSVP